MDWVYFIAVSFQSVINSDFFLTSIMNLFLYLSFLVRNKFHITERDLNIFLLVLDDVHDGTTILPWAHSLLWYNFIDLQMDAWGQSQWGFYGEFYDIKYHQFCWHGKKREEWSFMKCEESFITMKLIWHGYLVFSLGICVHKTSTETGLMCVQFLGLACAYGYVYVSVWLWVCGRVFWYYNYIFIVRLK